MSEEKPKVSLKDFVDDHQKLIAVIGVLIAIGLLWKVVNKDNSVSFVTYLCFFATIPIFIQITINWYRINGTFLLRIFMELLIGVILLSLGHLISDYPRHFDVLLSYAIPFLLFLGIGELFINLNKMVIYIWKDRIHAREAKKGATIEQIKDTLNEKEPSFQKWNLITEIVSVFILLILFLVSVIFYGEIRKFTLNAIEYTFERPLENSVEPLK